jgi:hypothetical protein
MHQWQKDGATQWFEGYASKILGPASDDLLWYHATLGETLRVKGVGPGGVAIAQATASASPTTGALTVAGGVGITGAVNVGDTLSINSYVVSGKGGTTGTYWFGNTATKNLTYDGTRFSFSGGEVMFPGFRNVGTGRFQMGGVGGGGAYYETIVSTDRFWVGTDTSADMFRIFAAPLGNIMTIPATVNAVTFTGTLTYNGWYSRQGFGGAGSPSATHIPYVSGVFEAWADATKFGNISLVSDYRVKKDVIDLPGMWDTVKALRPIKYTQAQFTPPSHIKFIAEETAKARKEAEENPTAAPREVSTAPLIPADDIERWGFIAHELQETLTPSASSGEKDSPDTIQSPNPFTLIAALTKALQEAMTRIEALEAR